MIYATDQRRRAVLSLDSLAPGAAFRWIVPPAVAGLFTSMPAGVTALPLGWLVVADSGNDRLLMVDPQGGTAIALSSQGSAIGAMRQPTAVAAMPDGRIVIADTGNHRLVFAGVFAGPAWSAWGESIGDSPQGFHTPTATCVDASSRILVADPGAARLVRIDAANGSGWTELALPPGGRTPRPNALAAGPGGGVLVSDLWNSRVLLLGADDSFTVLIDGAADGSLTAPVGVAMLGADVLVADAATASIGRWAPDAEAGTWVRAEQLQGDPRHRSGPEFSSLAGLAAAETSP